MAKAAATWYSMYGGGIALLSVVCCMAYVTQALDISLKKDFISASTATCFFLIKMATYKDQVKWQVPVDWIRSSVYIV